MNSLFTFYCCPNGLGHFRRILSVAEELLSLDEPEIRIICTEQQYNCRNYWNFEKATAPGAISFHTRKIARENGWLKNKEEYNSADYFEWIESLKNEKLLAEGVIVSDNLAGILTVRPDAILMGSFLWADILSGESHPEIRKMVDFETSILRQYQPEMICIDDMAMPAVRTFTRPYPVNWFGKSQHLQSTGKGILMSAGETGVYTDDCVRVIDSLLVNGFEVFADGRLYKAAGEAGLAVNSFDFSPADYARIGLVICRPGIGILTEALENGLPVIALDDESNPEISHNAARISKLSFGEALKFSEINRLGVSINEILNKHKLGYYQYLVRPPLGGALQAAEYLLNYNNESDLRS